MIKRLILTSIFLLSVISLFSQKWEKNETDEFTGYLVQETKFERVHQGFSYTILMKVKHIEYKDFHRTFLLIEYAHNNISVCKNKETNTILKFVDGETLTLQPNDEIDCGNCITISYILRNEVLEILESNQVEKFRIYFTDGYIDYNMKKPDYFERTLKFMNIE